MRVTFNELAERDDDRVTICMFTEASWRFYPDVRLAGLVRLLTWSLKNLDREVTVHGSNGAEAPWAQAQLGSKTAQVMLANERRLFLLDFWSHGFHLANGRFDTLRGAATAIHCWTSGSLSTVEFVSRFSNVVAQASASAFEADGETEQMWQDLLSTPHLYPPLDAVIRAAASRPELRCLFPFTSMFGLCFSRCTGYPYTNDCPSLWPLTEGRCVVHFPGGTSSEAMAVNEAVTVVVDHLPVGCGPAGRGTAADVSPPFHGFGD